MRIHILGSGGREHAIGWAFKMAGYEVHYYPGNAGTKRDGINHPCKDVISIIYNVDEKEIVIPGSEEFLVKGIADVCGNVFGPGKNAAMLEGSKIFAKKFMKKYGINTARFDIVERSFELEEKLKNFSPPYVIKADGLAKGKGVLICETFGEAIKKAKMLMEGKLLKGVEGPVILDEYLPGEELSAIAVVNGRKYVLLPLVRDYKRVKENDTGPNTGGMGSWGPVEVEDKIISKIEELFDRTLWGLEKEKIKYRGFLYLGLILVNDEPFVLEYNVRLGDPEAQVIVALNPERFVEMIIKAFYDENLAAFSPKGFAVNVVVASEGYPEKPRKNQKISLKTDGLFFFAGVSEKEGELVVSGGRVIHCVGKGESKEEARKKAYELVEAVEFDGKFYRRDIAI